MVCNTHQQEALEGLRSKKTLKWLIRPTSFWRYFAPCPLVDLRCGPRAMKILPDVPLAILKVTFFMVKVARTPPSSPKWRGMVIIHQKGGIWADFLAIFSILWLPRAPHMVGSGLSLPKILCQKFWYAILTTRRRWKVPRAKKNHEMAKKPPFFWRFFASWPHSRPSIWAYGASLRSLVQNLSHAL